MILSSNTLFHFTNNIGVLKSILENNFYPRCCVEDLSFLMPNYRGDDAKVGIPMVCFCDIPLSKINSHLIDYGYYGIGLTKQWGIECGINPIHYIQEETLAHKNIVNLEKSLANIIDDVDTINNYLRFRYKDKNIKCISDKIKGNMFKYFGEFAGFLKEYKGINNKNREEEKIFYDEREWRFIPPIIDNSIDGNTYRLTGKDCLNDDKKNCLNKTLQKYKLEFKATNVKYLIIKNDEELSDLIDHINGLSDERFSKYEKKILMTKIITVDNIKQDF